MKTIGFALGLLLAFTVAAGAQESSEETVDFDYLDVSRYFVESTHGAKYGISISRSFNLVGRLDHKAVYDDVGFNISMAVFAREGDLLLIHAEKHTDGSGGLDYSDLEPAKLSGLAFTRRTQCASEEDKEELDSNPQIRFIRSKGFEVTVPFQLEQYFTTSRDGTSEVVISYGRGVKECSEAIGIELRKELENVVKVWERELDPATDAYFLKFEIPIRGECDNRIGPDGPAVRGDSCVFGAGMERGIKVFVSRALEKKAWRKLTVKAADSDETASLFLASIDERTFESLFNIFFTKSFSDISFQVYCNKLGTRMDVLRELGFPTAYFRDGSREEWRYDLDRPHNCADMTVIDLIDGKVLSVGVIH